MKDEFISSRIKCSTPDVWKAAYFYYRRSKNIKAQFWSYNPKIYATHTHINRTITRTKCGERPRFHGMLQSARRSYHSQAVHEWCLQQGRRPRILAAYVERFAGFSDNICEPKQVSITISRSQCIYRWWVHRLCCYVKHIPYRDKGTMDVTLSRGRRVDYVKTVMTPATSRSRGCALKQGYRAAVHSNHFKNPHRQRWVPYFEV